MSDWYYLVDNEQKGPVAESALKGHFSSKELPAETFVWKEGMEGWVCANQMPVFFSSPDSTLVELPVSAVVQADAPQVVAEKMPGALIGCAQCQSPAIVPGYSTPLCEPCRNSLVNRPVPLWLKIAAGVLVVLMLISAIRIPRELIASVEYERAQMAEQQGDYATAVSEYKKALLSYPKSIDILGGLARSAHRAGDQDTAIQCVNQLVAQIGPSGEVSKDTLSVINEVRGTKP